MSLSCECDWDDPDWWYDDSRPVEPLATKRSRRCVSCNDRIKVGDDCKEFTRWRHARYDTIEERIYGEGGEVPMASWYLCDRCAGLYESLDDLGFCGLLGEKHDLRETCREYADMQRQAGVFKGSMEIHK